MKKILCAILAIFMMLSITTGCNDYTEKENTKKLKVVTTIFPEYDWVREIMGDNVDNAEITMLLDNGVDLHSYQPTADDIVKTTKSDKKMVGNKIKFVLLRSVGDAYIDMSVTDDEMKQVLQG
mgnify:CR=1 FL=1